MTLPPIQCTYKFAVTKSDVLRARGQKRPIRCQDEALSFFRSRKKGFYIARCKTHHPDSESIPGYKITVFDQISQEEYVIGMVMES